MHRPFTRAQALQNRAFLVILARTGNARLAAREIGVVHSTFHTRRAKHSGFAGQWEAAVAKADARLRRAGGKRGPKPSPEAHGRERLRTRGGEPMVVHSRTRKLQLRPAHRNKLTSAAERAFLKRLSATANIHLSAEEAGCCETSFHRRRRRNSEFAADVAEILARARPNIERWDRERGERALDEVSRAIDEGPMWPPGLTIADAIRTLQRLGGRARAAERRLGERGRR